MIPSLVRVLHGSANTLEAIGARRRVAGCPAGVEASYDFITAFRHGAIDLSPIQVREEMVAFLRRLAHAPPRSILELGTARGGTLFLFTRVASDDATLVTVDLPDGPFGGGYPRSRVPLLRSFARGKQSVHLVRADTHEPATLERVQSILKEKVDLLFIDADHSYEGVRRDFEMYSPLVRPGGLVAFHDIVSGPPEYVGGVPRFWGEVRHREQAEEIVADPGQGGYGIGVIQITSGREDL